MAKGPPPTPPAACAADQVVKWDGSKYVCRNQRVCPADMVDTGAFCIDKVRTAAADWQEWIGSCKRRVALGITVPFDGNFEYVDEYGVMNDFPGGAYDQSAPPNAGASTTRAGAARVRPATTAPTPAAPT